MSPGAGAPKKSFVKLFNTSVKLRAKTSDMGAVLNISLVLPLFILLLLHMCAYAPSLALVSRP